MGASPAVPPPDLAEVAAAWATLPGPVKAGVLAMVRAATNHQTN